MNIINICLYTKLKLLYSNRNMILIELHFICLLNKTGINLNCHKVI